MSAAVVAVSVAWATPDVQEVVPLALPAGATAGDAVARSGLVERYRIDPGAVRLGISGTETSQRVASCPRDWLLLAVQQSSRMSASLTRDRQQRVVCRLP